MSAFIGSCDFEGCSTQWALGSGYGSTCAICGKSVCPRHSRRISLHPGCLTKIVCVACVDTVDEVICSDEAMDHVIACARTLKELRDEKAEDKARAESPGGMK